jgi:hypothetical protein
MLFDHILDWFAPFSHHFLVSKQVLFNESPDPDAFVVYAKLLIYANYWSMCLHGTA